MLVSYVSRINIRESAEVVIAKRLFVKCNKNDIMNAPASTIKSPVVSLNYANILHMKKREKLSYDYAN